MLLDSRTITTPLSAVPSATTSAGVPAMASCQIQVVFTYGSGGTSGTLWVQSSFDGGTTWVDIYAFSFTTANKSRIVNLSSRTPIAPYLPTDGTLANDTTKDGLLFSLFRTKVSSVGTYAGTTLTVDILPGP